MDFEQTVRPLIGEDYDTRFPARRTATPDRQAPLTDAEATFATNLARLYHPASHLSSAEKIRHSLIGALKTLRRDAEARNGRELARAARGWRPKYRYRVTAPDGTELTYPKNGTIYTNQRYVLLMGQLPSDPALVRRYVERYYQPYVDYARLRGNTEREEELLAAIERDLAKELTQDARDLDWRVWAVENQRHLIEKRKAYYAHEDPLAEGELPPRYQYEWVVAEGTPFEIIA